MNDFEKELKNIQLSTGDKFQCIYCGKIMKFNGIKETDIKIKITSSHGCKHYLYKIK